MKFTLLVDKEADEEVIVHVKEESTLSEEIRRLCSGQSTELIGTNGNVSVILDPRRICCFTVEGSKVIAMTDNGNYQVKKRLYNLENELTGYLKINQSCLANIKMIDHFEASFGTSLLVIFKNGHRDYVSRRNVKRVKERFGL